MRTADKRLSILERRGTPDDLPVIVFTCRDGSDRSASISAMNSEPTPAAVAVRAELEAEGYIVAPGYGRGCRRGASSHSPASSELWRVHYEVVGPPSPAKEGTPDGNT